MAYQSVKDPHDTFIKTIETIKQESLSFKTPYFFNISFIHTLLGPMFAIANDSKLHVLEFFNEQTFSSEMQLFCTQNQISLSLEKTAIMLSVAKELRDYFSGKLQIFKTPFQLSGTPFQIGTWNALRHVPYGKTWSYLQQAAFLGKPKAVRAVGNANGANRLAILIPCHRIINHNQKWGGYGGGLMRKKWLIEHERRHAKNDRIGKECYL